jgi:N-acetylglucosaminyldiphosphoundecaprenol N-acetyl-beta-D-mannosaminyltransferase
MTRIFGIKLDGYDKETVRNITEQFLFSNKLNLIATVNPEMLLEAREDKVFKKTLQSADLRVVDGFGVQLVSALTGQSIPPRMTGMDVCEIICELARSHDKSVALIGGKPGQAKHAARHLSENFGVRSAGLHGGLIAFKEGKWDTPENTINRLRQIKPDILLVALGHNKQERWINEVARQLPSVRVAVGVGGLFAFLAGDIKRAPVWMQKIGLEWLWRLFKEPRRLKRILRAVFVFPFRVIFQ